MSKRQGLVTFFAGCTLAVMAWPGAARAQTLMIEDVVGRVHVETGVSDTIEVEVSVGEGLVAQPVVTREGDLVRIDGGLHNARASCRDRGEEPRISVNRGRRRPVSDFPVITVRAPAGLNVNIHGAALYIDIGDVAQTSVVLRECGQVSLGDATGSVRLHTEGVGDIHAGDFAGGALMVTGTGDILAGHADGDVRAGLDGTGAIYVASVAGHLDAELNGTGEIAVEELQGSFAGESNGTGDIRIAAGHASVFRAEANGFSASVVFDGTAGNADLEANGFANIRVAAVEGQVTREANMARITVGGRDRNRRDRGRHEGRTGRDD